ncbi:MAG TPA: FAD-dependent oxidoreductase [Solirubrobacteraceae bacterium]|nr:FAD-dependent oxidoreductase [Solirubrobacteraceae bacterium]
MRTGELGFWWRSLPTPPPHREPLRGSIEVDVAIVGAGYTGLWTAYYLKRAQPSQRVVIVEAERVGFGASGRNGGWVSGFFAGAPRVYERERGRAALVALQRTMFATVAEIAAVIERERIDADLLHSGQLDVALDRPQAERLREHVRALHALGFDERDLCVLDRDQLAERVRIDGAQLASCSPHVARVHPAKLVAGLAAAVEQAGTTIYERTPIREISAGEARGDGALARALDRSRD